MDKSAVGWDHIEKVEKHDSQKGKKFIKNLYDKFEKLILDFLVYYRLFIWIWRKIWRSSQQSRQVCSGMGSCRKSGET